MSKHQGVYPWDAGSYSPPLQPELYGNAFAAASQPHVQNAETVEEMIRRSGVPERYWSEAKGKKANLEDPADEETARDIASRMLGIRGRLRVDRVTMAELLKISEGVFWRIEHGKIQVGEVTTVIKELNQLERKK